MIESWLELLCQCIPGVQRAVVLRAHGGKSMSVWPVNGWSDAEVLALTKIPSHKKMEAGRVRLDANTMQFSQPLKTKGVCFATLFLECTVDDGQVNAVELLLLWSQTWLELLAKKNRESNQQTHHLLDVLEKASAYDDLAKNSYAFCSHLASQLPLKQVVFCTSYRGKVNVLSVSKTPQHDSRTQPFEQLTSLLESMDSDAYEQQKKHFDEWLLRNNPDTNCQVFPLGYEDNVFGYLVIYFSNSHEEIASVRDQISLFIRYLSPMYFKLYWAQLSFLQRMSDRVRTLIFDRTKTTQRLIYTGVIVLCIGMLLIPVDYKVKAEAHIEGSVQRAIVVPEDGYLKEVYVKTGEKIKKGQLIALLDEKSIRLDVQRWKNEKQEYEREYNRELTALNHVQMRIAQAKIAQAQAKLSMFQNRLDKTRIQAPIDGVIIKGDLSRAVGAPVKKGQVLYEMSPNNDFKLVLLVAEERIIHLREGQAGWLQLSAFPSQKMQFKVLAISFVFEEKASQLQYRVEAKLQGVTIGLRPGMTGTGKVIIEKRFWAHVLTQPLIHQLKIWWWTLF